MPADPDDRIIRIQSKSIEDWESHQIAAKTTIHRLFIPKTEVSQIGVGSNSWQKKNVICSTILVLS